MHFLAVRHQSGSDDHIFRCFLELQDILPNFLICCQVTSCMSKFYNYPKKKSEFLIFSLYPNNHVSIFFSVAKAIYWVGHFRQWAGLIY